MAKTILLTTAVIFFALNMGGSGIAPSFAANYGSKMIKKNFAVFLFTIAVLLGALTVGRKVVKTLSSGVIPSELISADVALIIILTATFTLTLANFLKIPESTSMVTVGAITGAGIFFNRLQVKVLSGMLLMWIILPIASYVLTYHIYKVIYPPSAKNLWIYEKIFVREKELKLFSLLASCYGAYAIGTNNVANAVGPLVGAGVLSPSSGLLLVTPFFGFGGLILGKRTMETFGNEIVPLGAVSAPLICLVTSTLLLSASALGFPFPYVQLTALSILAINSVKNGCRYMMKQNVVKKIILVWTVTPLISIGLSILLLSIFIKG